MTVAMPAAAISPPRRSPQLLQPRPGEQPRRDDPGRRWGTVGFMLAIHVLALVALLPGFWSWQAVSTLLILYWVTACLGVTIGYHRLLCHRASVSPMAGAVLRHLRSLSCQHDRSTGWDCTATTTSSPIRMPIITTNRGFWWSHMGWMFEEIPAMAAAAPER